MLVRYRMFPTILVAGVLAGCAAGPARSPAQEEADAVATGRVYAALDANRIYYFRDVDVRVSNGVARLSGYVWSADALYCAEKVARGVPGVTRVADEMQLERAMARGGGDGGG
ncbi:MAG: BON domain-containing protein [Steroidobacteraceae bacterium]|jgi:osmotically-inducible protein OsmY